MHTTGITAGVTWRGKPLQRDGKLNTGGDARPIVETFNQTQLAAGFFFWRRGGAYVF